MFAIGARTRRAAAREPAWLLATALTGYLISLSSCGPRLTPEQEHQQKVLEAIESTYAYALDRDLPAYVVVTYPTTRQSLPEMKRHEADIVERLLQQRGVPVVFKRRIEAQDVSSASEQGENPPSYLPADIAAGLIGKTVLLLHLDVDPASQAPRNLVTRDKHGTLRIWNDPVSERSPRRS